jgi:alpha-beta hydrolase superfamily lysophospholipase
LDNISCDVDIGCQGDYSSFSQLGQEVNNAITTIKKYLGNHTEIVLLGHSRGGLADQ